MLASTIHIHTHTTNPAMQAKALAQEDSQALPLWSGPPPVRSRARWLAALPAQLGSSSFEGSRKRGPSNVDPRAGTIRIVGGFHRMFWIPTLVLNREVGTNQHQAHFKWLTQRWSSFDFFHGTVLYQRTVANRLSHQRLIGRADVLRGALVCHNPIKAHPTYYIGVAENQAP